MIILRPDLVTFGPAVWRRVERLAIDFTSARTVQSWSDDGPHPTFVDAPARTVRVRVTQALDLTDLDAPRPGDLAELRAEFSAGGDHARRVLRVAAVVESVTHDLSPRVAVRAVTLLAQADAGDEDPVTVTTL